MMAQLAPSSSPFTYTYIYDVFLSFHGEDTRTGFTINLCSALSQIGVLTYMDDYDLIEGEKITPSLLRVIQSSMMAIVIFSRNYASSTFCLNELVEILDCYKKQKMWIWPVFYDVDPSEVRHQTGSFGEAFTEHELGRFKHDKEKLRKWRLALNQAADMSCSHFKPGGEYEHVFIRKIVEGVSCKLNRPLLHVANYPVGLESRMQVVQSILGTVRNNKVNVLGIFGIGGIGKSTVARSIYNLIAYQFEGSSFLANVREKSTKQGLKQVQETMLYELIGERNFKLGDVNQGIQSLKERLHRRKVLLILDDVDEMEQLQATAGGLDWFGSGSIIIIITRDKHLLKNYGVDYIYKVRRLHVNEAFRLFRWNALKNNKVDPSYMEITKRAIHYACGLPLALEAIGSNLFGKTLDEWKSAVEAYERIPNKDVRKILKVSYDGLKEDEKEIFLDIACFFKGCSLRYVRNMLQARGFHPKDCIGVLEEKSLINIWRYNGEIIVTMHDLIQSMGKKIVRQQSKTRPEKRKRLLFNEDVVFILEKSMKENDLIEAVMLDLPNDKIVEWNQEVLGKMKNLRMLVKRNTCFFRGPKQLPSSLRVLEWWGYPYASLPSNFHLKNLVILNLSYSRFQWNKPLEKSEALSQLIFTGCEDLRQIPDVSGFPNLTELCVDDCTNLIRIHDSVGFLDNLLRFSAKGCTTLRIVPPAIRLTSLEYLCLRDCSNLVTFPEILGPMEKLESVDLEGTAIKNLPLSMRNLKGVQRLYLNRCTKMIENIELCNIIQRLSNCFLFLKTLRLRGSNLTILPECIEECRFLKLLDLSYCKQLREIRGLPVSIDDFLAYNCTSLKADCSTLNMIQSQAILSATRKFSVLPRQRIPEWFDHTSKGNSICFWFRNGFPSITVSAVLGVPDNSERPIYVNFHLCGKINDIEMPLGFGFDFDFNHFLETDHIFMFKNITDPKYWGLEGLLSENEWNYGEVLFVTLPDSDIWGSIKWTGVHVNREMTTMEEFRFTNPYPPKSKSQLGLLNPAIQMWIRSSMHSHWEQPLDEVYSNYASPNDGFDFSCIQPEWTTVLDGAFLDHQAKDPGQSSQAQRTTSTSGQVGPKLSLGTSFTMLPKTIDASLTNQTELTQDEGEVEPFYSSPDAEICVSSEAASQALKIVQDFISKDASVLLHPELCSVKETRLKYLSNLSADHGISRDMRTLTSEASRKLTNWSRDYIEPRKKIESTSSDLQRADELKISLEVNMKRFREELALEHELNEKLASMEESKRELEEQINVIKANISASQSEKHMTLNRKRDIFKEGKTLKTQRDELVEKTPRLKYEHGFAKETQSRINSEWSELREKFKKIAEE